MISTQCKQFNIFLSVFSINFFHFTNKFRTSNIWLIGYTQQCLDNSSIKETKYWWPSSNAVLIRPQTSTWTQSKRPFEWWRTVPNFIVVFLSRTQRSTNFKLQVNAPSSNSYFANACKESKPICPSLICHNLVESSSNCSEAGKFSVIALPSVVQVVASNALQNHQRATRYLENAFSKASSHALRF